MATEQTPIDMAIEALEACIDDFGNRGSRLTLEMSREAIAALRAMPTQESAEPVEVTIDRLIRIAPITTHMGAVQTASVVLRHALTNEHLYTHPPKTDQTRVVLTDEEIKRILNTNCYEDLNDSRQGGYVTSSDHDAYDMGMLAGLLYARDGGYLAPAKLLPMDEVMEVVNAAYTDGLAGKRGGMEAYRAHITAKFGQQ